MKLKLLFVSPLSIVTFPIKEGVTPAANKLLNFSLKVYPFNALPFLEVFLSIAEVCQLLLTVSGKWGMIAD